MKESFGQPDWNSQRGIDGIRIVSRCPICQTEHNPLEASILDEVEGSHLLYVKCKKCNSGVVASVTPGNLGISSIGVLTDLSGSEIRRAKDWGRIGADDVLDVVRYFGNDDKI